MKPPAVHQLLPVFTARDAVGSSVLRFQQALRRAGFRSQIFAELIDPRLRRQGLPATALPERVTADDCVIYHLSIGSRVARLFARLPSKRVVYYHNVTPREFYSGVSPRVEYWLVRGRTDLAALAPIVDLCVAPSAYSLEEFGASCANARVLPLPLDLERLHPRMSTPAEPPVILFVGRIAPNKRQSELIRYLAALRATDIPAARLALVGGAEDTSPYLRALKAFAAQLNVGDAVDFAGTVDDRELTAHYRAASVFACASLHEGFGVPVIEAMSFGVPVVARAAAAVPETVGDAALLLDDDDPLVWAAALSKAIDDQPLRTALRRAGTARAAEFAESRFSAALVEALESIGVSAPASGVASSRSSDR